MLHVNMLSGGIVSWATGKWVAQHHGTGNLIHVFADTLWEDEDLYRFLPEAVANIGGRLVRLCLGKTPWELFNETGMIGNTRVDICSRALKRELIDKWAKDNCDPADTIFYVGMLWFERHRFEGGKDKGRGLKARKADDGWHYEAPLIYEPMPLGKKDILAWMEHEGLTPPAMYDDGFTSNNCRGACVKQGQAGWIKLLQKRPWTYAEVEGYENAFRQRTGKDVAILRDRRGGTTKPFTLTMLRERHEAGERCDMNDHGHSCQCLFSDEEMEAAHG